MAENIITANLNTSDSVTADNHSSPWTRNVRGESEPPIVSIPLSPPSMAVIESPVVEEEEDEGDENASSGSDGNAGKRMVWNKPSNAADIGPVMGTNKWPALSAKAPSKSSPDSPRALFDGSSSSVVPVSQGSGSGTPLSTLQKSVSSSVNTNSNLTPNHGAPARQRSMKRNSSNSTSNGGLSQPPPQGPVVESPINSPSSRDNTQRSGFIAQSHTGGTDHPHPNPRNFRHRNGGMHPRGDGSHNQNFGGRRNQDHGNHEWTGRHFNSRDGHMQPRGVPRLMRHPPPPPPLNTIPFIAPTPMRPFGTPMGYPEMGSLYILPAASPDSLRPFPFVGPPMPPAYFQAPELPHDNQLHASIMNQIDYYFSNENLIKDTYLRQNMDDQGWVPIKLIAGFKKVSLLTDNIQLIKDALQSSTVVEVQGDKLRKRIDWMRWIMSPSVQFPTISGQDKLVDRVRSISLEQEQKTTNQSGARSQDDSNAGGLPGRLSFGDFNNQSQLFHSEVASISAQGGSASN